MRIMFLSNSAIVGVGHDFNPMLFSQAANNFWSFSEFVDKKPTEAAVKINSGGFSAGKLTLCGAAEMEEMLIFARSLFESKVMRGQSSDATQLDKDMLWMKHESNITCIQPYAQSASGGVTEFSTSGNGLLYSHAQTMSFSYFCSMHLRASTRWPRRFMEVEKLERGIEQAASVKTSLRFH
ncbi:hypothetical protein KXD40_002120 [Peronospora effusa]|nr:hypothetical protein KXD40_002120 [Peronospora effusa]